MTRELAEINFADVLRADANTDDAFRVDSLLRFDTPVWIDSSYFSFKFCQQGAAFSQGLIIAGESFGYPRESLAFTTGRFCEKRGLSMRECSIRQRDFIHADSGIILPAPDFKQHRSFKPFAVVDRLHPLAVVIDREAVVRLIPDKENMAPLVGLHPSMPKREFLTPTIARDRQDPSQTDWIERQNRLDIVFSFEAQDVPCRRVSRLRKIGPESDLQRTGLAGKRIA